MSGNLGGLLLAQLLYLALGAGLLPLLRIAPDRAAPAARLGLAYMVGPTGGFLLGFLLCAFLVGWAVDRGAGRNWLVLPAMTSSSRYPG